MSKVISVAVAGAGRMGRHHARLYAGMADVRLVGILDPDQPRAAQLAQEFKCQAFASVAEMLAGPDVPGAVTIAAPTIHHRALAEALLPEKISLLIEKPLAPSLADAQAIVDLAKKHGCVLQVGHSERFNPVVQALNAHQLSPQFVEVHRISPMTFRSIDVGVVLDLMIHDIDIVHHFVRSPVKSVAAVGVNVIGKFEDVANARIVFANGCVANLTASRLALKTERKMRLFSPTAYVSVDYHKKSGVIIRRTANEQQLALVQQKVAAGEVAELTDLNYAELVNYEPLQVHDNEPLRLEIEAFIKAIRTGDQPPVTGEDGCFAVDVATRIMESIAEHEWQATQPGMGQR